MDAVGSRPFDEGERDCPLASGLNGPQHGLAGDRGGIALALETELVLVDGAGAVGREHQFEVHELRGGGPDRNEDKGKERHKGAANRRAE